MKQRPSGLRVVSHRLGALVIGGLWALASAGAATASPWIEVRFSIKVIRDPATGARPSIQGNGAVASFPPPDLRSNHVVMVGSRSLDPAFIPTFAASLVAHEMGHYFGLAHPNAAACKANECFTPTCPNPVPGDGDGLGDTLPDDPCYSADQLSQYFYGKNYAQLNPTELAAIDNILWNNMSYLHPGQDYGQAFMFLRTENQLDRFADIASADTSRVPVRSGRTWVVSPSGSIFGSGLSVNPFRWPSQGQDAASLGGGDIVLLKPGVYGQNVVFDRPLTLRVARFGTAVIGN